jgi:hypothetical protein
MEFTCEGVIDAPVEVVYATLRDDLPKLVPFLDNVSAIAELERKPGTAGKTHVLNRWRADAGNVPSAVRPFLKPEMLEWLDHAEWDDTGRHVDWWIEPPTFKDLYRCQGRNSVEERGSSAAIVIRAKLTLDPDKIPGVPGFLARKVAPAVEGYMVERIRPNLAGLAVGVGRYLKAKVSK